MPWYIPSSGAGVAPAGPTVPPLAKTSNYTFTVADDGVPIQFNALIGALVGTLPDPLTMAGRTFMASKDDASANPVDISFGPFMYTLADPGSSVVIMAANGEYIVIANYTP